MESSYGKLLKTVGDESEKNENLLQEVSLFRLLQGRNSKNSLMIVGRAVNSWGKTYKVEDFKIKNREIVDEIFSKKSNAEMDWVSDSWGTKNNAGYNSKRSAFWRVIHDVNMGLRSSEENVDPNWSGDISWSNLYKISPTEGGNPSPDLCSAQQEQCAIILREEIKLVKPKYLIFFTGRSWAQPFFNHWGKSVHGIPCDGLVEWGGEVFGCQALVAKHPQGKSHRKLVNEVFQHLEMKK